MEANLPSWLCMTSRTFEGAETSLSNVLSWRVDPDLTSKIRSRGDSLARRIEGDERSRPARAWAQANSVRITACAGSGEASHELKSQPESSDSPSTRRPTYRDSDDVR
jgi:hypothetical protein